LRIGRIAINYKSQKCQNCSKSPNTFLHLQKVEQVRNKTSIKAQEVKNETKEIIAAYAIAEDPVH